MIRDDYSYLNSFQINKNIIITYFQLIIMRQNYLFLLFLQLIIILILILLQFLKTKLIIFSLIFQALFRNLYLMKYHIIIDLLNLMMMLSLNYEENMGLEMMTFLFNFNLNFFDSFSCIITYNEIYYKDKINMDLRF